jgi:hypothetical protein
LKTEKTKRQEQRKPLTKIFHRYTKIVAKILVWM